MVDGAQGPVLLFDGVCNLCHGCVRFVLRHDRRKIFRFASQQSAYGQEAMARHGLSAGASVYLVEGGVVYAKSTAVLKTLWLLGYPWRLFYAFIALPRGLRDGAYDFVGARRYRLFGKMESCPVPDPAVKDRFMG